MLGGQLSLPSALRDDSYVRRIPTNLNYFKITLIRMNYKELIDVSESGINSPNELCARSQMT